MLLVLQTFLSPLFAFDLFFFLFFHKYVLYLVMYQSCWRRLVLRLRTLCKWMWSKGESGSGPGRVAPKCELGGGDKDHRVQPKSWSCGRRQLRSHFLKSPPSHTLGRCASPALIRSRWLAVCWKWKRPKWPRNPSVPSRQFVTTGALGKTTKCPGVYRKCASLRTLDWVRVQAS